MIAGLMSSANAGTDKCGCGQEAEDDTLHVIHTLSVVLRWCTRRDRSRVRGSAAGLPPRSVGHSCTPKNKIHAES